MKKKVSVKYLVDRNHTRLYIAILKAEKQIQKLFEGGEKDE